jgi:hypothetical protein
MQNKSIEKLYEYLSQKSREAYKDPLLIENVVLSKQETRGRVLEMYLAGKTPPEITYLFILKMLFLYAIKNLLSFTLCLITALLHRISGQKFSAKEAGELVILDTFFIANRILEKGQFEDNYFTGLSQYLAKIEKTYTYVPRLSDSRNPFKLFRVFKILKKYNIPALTHYQVLGSSDYLEAIRFLFLYPFSVLRFIKTLGNSYEDQILRYGLWAVLGSVVLDSHIRFLLGKRLSAMRFNRIKCIGWYENQASDKTFYRGLRHVPGKTEIIGAQLFLNPNNAVINATLDEQEIPFNVVPDKLLVTGPACCFESDNIKVEVGPNFRYKNIYEVGSQVSKGEFILILMSYFDHVTDFILSIICDVEWSVPVKIKFHPITDQKKYKAKISKKIFVTDESISDLLPRTLMGVGRATGVQLQLAACGIPVIDIENPNEFSLDTMPEAGKGIIWDRATNAEEVTKLARQFQKSLQSNPDRLREEGLRLKSLYFSKPTEELINRAFGFN